MAIHRHLTYAKGVNDACHENVVHIKFKNKALMEFRKIKIKIVYLLLLSIIKAISESTHKIMG